MEVMLLPHIWPAAGSKQERVAQPRRKSPAPSGAVGRAPRWGRAACPKAQRACVGRCRRIPSIHPSIHLSIYPSIHPSLSSELLLPLSAKPQRTRSAQRSDGTLLSWLFFFSFCKDLRLRAGKMEPSPPRSESLLSAERLRFGGKLHFHRVAKQKYAIDLR